MTTPRTYNRNASFEEPVFQDPPEQAFGRHRGGQSRHARLAASLRERPGEWALIAKYEQADRASSVASLIRRGRSTAWEPAGAFEAVFNGGDLYARYVGEED